MTGGVFKENLIFKFRNMELDLVQIFVAGFGSGFARKQCGSITHWYKVYSIATFSADC
jgi:hypothetical protein